MSQARAASGSQPGHNLASATLGDARSLNHSEGSADAVLLMGPLYHLTARDERLTALREAHQDVKAWGIALFAKAINRFATLLDGLVKGYIDDLSFVSILLRDLEEGQRPRSSRWSRSFHNGVPTPS